ncbi:MAG: hypothetical protein GX089_00945 [Fibrobacter sp.]|nr:hypothetical protein [Fibrobacter sp.]
MKHIDINNLLKFLALFAVGESLTRSEIEKALNISRASFYRLMNSIKIFGVIVEGRESETGFIYDVKNFGVFSRAKLRELH